MREDINVSKIKDGDRVKVSLYGLPESDWLEVSAAFPNCAEVIMPDGRDRLLTPSDITAHEPAAPALPDWWGDPVVRDGPSDMRHYYTYDRRDDGYRSSSGNLYGSEFFTKNHADVTVVVDRDGNMAPAPAVAALIRENDDLRTQRDEARTDLAALRAEVAKVRDSLSIRADEHLRHDDQAFDRGASYVGHDAAARLTAILGGDDQ